MLKNLTNPVLCHSLFGWCLGCWTIKRDFLAAADFYSIFLIRQPSPILKRSNRITRSQNYICWLNIELSRYWINMLKMYDIGYWKGWHIYCWTCQFLKNWQSWIPLVTRSRQVIHLFLTNTKMFCMLQQREWMKWFYQDFRSTVMTQ